MNNKKMILYVLCVISIVLQIVAISTTKWSTRTGKQDNVSAEISYGLWKSCADIKGGSVNASKCVHIPTGDNKNFPKHSLNACRVFAILGVVFTAAALLCITMCKNHTRWQLGFLIAGALCTILSVVIWAAELLKFKDDADNTMKFDPGYSYYLNLGGGIITLFAAGYLYWGKSAQKKLA